MYRFLWLVAVGGLLSGCGPSTPPPKTGSEKAEAPKQQVLQKPEGLLAGAQLYANSQYRS